MAKALPISRLVNVSVNLSPLAAQMQNISTLLLLGSSSVIDVVERYRVYNTIAAVAADFGTSAPEYLAAVLWFQQAPQPVTLQIGRWAKTATAGKLVGAPLSTTNSNLATWTAISTGSFKIGLDGGAAADLTGIDFSAQTSLNGVASVIQTKLRVSYANSLCVYNSVFNRFEISSGTTGATSAVSFVQAAATGTDISALLQARSTDSGAYVANGMLAETALAAVTLFDNNYGQSWYAVALLGAANSDYTAVGGYIEAATNKHLQGVTTQEAGVLTSGDTTNAAYLLQQLGYKRSVVQYSSTSPYAVASLLARILTTDYNANSSVITLMYKQEPGIIAETLGATQLTNLESYNANVFIAYNNGTAIIEKGTVATGEFLDTITGTDWLALAIQTEVFNLLYTSPTKIPQTDSGNNVVVTCIESVCSQAVYNGLVTPGVWGSSGFGALAQGDFLPKGFYIYAPPIATQNSSNRAARKSVPFQVAVKLAGAIHTVDITINVNR